MEIVAWSGIFIGVVLFLAWPMVRPGKSRSPHHQDGMELLARKEEAYAALTDLELDYRMGKISEMDYRELKEKYRLEALALLGRIDEKDDVGELLEREIKARRKQPACPSCGASRAGADRFCRKCGAALVAVLLLLLLPGLAGAAALEGRLSNKTPNGGKVGNVEVTLIFSQSGKEEKRTAKTDAKGKFRIADLDPGERYLVNFQYEGADYYAAAEFDKTQEKLQIEIPVYDSTSDASSLRVKRHYLLVTPGDGSLRVEELLQVENAGQRAFIGSRSVDSQRRATIELTLPQGAAAYQYGDGLMEHCVVAAPGGFVDTMDVKPGVREIVFAYTLPVNSDRYPLIRRLDYTTDALNVFVGGGIGAESPGLEATGVVQTPNGRYLRLAGENLAAGASVTVALASLPARPVSFRYPVFAAMALILIAALVYLLAGRRKRYAQTAASEAMPRARYRDLLEAVARLDDAFEAGELRREEYERVRAQKKAELLALAEQTKKVGEGAGESVVSGHGKGGRQQ